jgi:integrase
MKQKKPPLRGMGRLFRRRSRLTGEELPTLWIAYRVDGRERRESSHSSDPEVAKALLKKRLNEAQEGMLLDPGRERQTVDMLLDALLAYYDVHGHRSIKSARSQVKPWRAACGSCRALDVTTARLLRHVKAWQADGKTTTATINRRLGLLRRAYRLAKLRIDPARLDFTDCMLGEASPRGRYLDAAAFGAIHKALPEYLRDFVEFAYLCGTRKRQLALTTWAHWNAEVAEFTWPAAEVKAKHPHVLPLAGRPLELIRSRHTARKLHCRYVFHGPHCAPGRKSSKQYGCVGDFKKAWARASKAAGFPIGRKHGGFVFHNTRHTAVTNLVNAGVPAHEAMSVSGHRTRSVFDRYSLTLKEQTRRALERQTTYTAEQRAQATPKVEPITARLA